MLCVCGRGGGGGGGGGGVVAASCGACFRVLSCLMSLCCGFGWGLSHHENMPI